MAEMAIEHANGPTSIQRLCGDVVMCVALAAVTIASRLALGSGHPALIFAVLVISVAVAIWFGVRRDARDNDTRALSPRERELRRLSDILAVRFWMRALLRGTFWSTVALILVAVLPTRLPSDGRTAETMAIAWLTILPFMLLVGLLHAGIERREAQRALPRSAAG